ncbi:general secretion pathway protein GspN [Cognatilysobacter terrigena]|uniref:general secretion pathway protein GspN n=1 Tax=Cognatilysobacter terrigena TaxID=2488749 RepID=UPI0010603A39|nr:general secretion pathway protein GspN [Lysobacter terrigena]
MRLDHVAPRTVLLAGFAGWALLAWVLALAGMGGQVPEGKGGTIAGSRIPTLPAEVPGATLGPIGQYGEIAARPLFATDRRPHPFSLVTDDQQTAGAADFDLVLTSVLITPQASIAIVQKPDGSESWRVKIGDAPDSFPAWRLTSLQPRSAVFEGPEGQKELTLRVYDGKGGAAPTASTTSVPAASVPPNPVGMPVPTAPPPTDAASQPDPAQIEQIRQRIEARREEMRRRAQNANPPATAVPPPTNR